MFGKIPAAFSAAKLWLDTNGGEGTSFGVLCVVVFALMYLLRKWPVTAKLWERVAAIVPIGFDMNPGLILLSKAWQGLFPTLVSAALGALATGGNVKAAMIAAAAGPVTVFGHEFAKWVPWLPYRGAVNAKALLAKPKPSKRDDDDGDGSGGGSDDYDDVTPRDNPPPMAARALLATGQRRTTYETALLLVTFMLAVCGVSACASLTDSQRSTVKTIFDIGRDLCLSAFHEQHAALSVADVEKAYCQTSEQVDPFVQQLLAAKRAALAEPEEFKKVSGSGCDAAVENSKRLGCPFDVADAGAWCSAQPKKKVDCLAHAENCYALSICPPVTK